MKLLFTTLATAALLVCAAMPTAAQEKTEQHSLKDDEARTGSKFRRSVIKSGGIPFNLTYEQLSEEQKNMLKSRYESMGPNDEPPFPEKGRLAMMKEVYEAQKVLDVRGTMTLLANVDAQGKATAVRVVESVDPRMDMYVAGILIRTKFKPARCNGVPCAQDFVFDMTWSLTAAD